jgi:AbrB family looped-hinge helix DNA binding protein
MSATSETVVIGRQGRLVIPVGIRAALGLEPGAELELRVDGDKLILQRPEGAVAALRRLGDSIPRGRSLVDELLAERRLAAAAE